MNQLFNLIRYIVTKIIFKRGSFTHCILISCAKQLRIFYKNFQTHSGEGIVLCIFIKYTQNMPYMSTMYIHTIHIQNIHKHSTLHQSVYPLFCTIYLLQVYIGIAIYISQRCWVVCSFGGGGVVDTSSLHFACTSTTPFKLYALYIQSMCIVHIFIQQYTLTIHEKMRMWDDV